MSKKKNTSISPSRPAMPRSSSASAEPSLRLDPSTTKLLLVEFRSGEEVCKHPEVASLLEQGWCIKSAVPRIVEDEGTRLFVVLTQGDDRSKRSSGQAVDKTSQRSTSSLLNDQTASSE